jgi:hypothetical protein
MSTSPSHPLKQQTRDDAMGKPVADIDRAVLECAAVHDFINPIHVEALTGESNTSTRQRLVYLATHQLLTHRPTFHREPSRYQITSAGLRAIGSPLPLPRYEIIRNYRHQHGVVWLWLAARIGKYGDAQEILTPRVMRARDQADAAAPHPRWPTATHRPSRRRPRYGIRIPSDDPDQPAHIHYPDLMLTFGESRARSSSTPPTRPRDSSKPKSPPTAKTPESPSPSTSPSTTTSLRPSRPPPLDRTSRTAPSSDARSKDTRRPRRPPTEHAVHNARSPPSTLLAPRRIRVRKEAASTQQRRNPYC